MAQLGDFFPHTLCVYTAFLWKSYGEGGGANLIQVHPRGLGAPAWSWSTRKSTEVESTQKKELMVVTSARPPGLQSFKLPRARPQNPRQKFPSLLEEVQAKLTHLPCTLPHLSLRDYPGSQPSKAEVFYFLGKPRGSETGPGAAEGSETRMRCQPVPPPGSSLL